MTRSGRSAGSSSLHHERSVWSLLDVAGVGGADRGTGGRTVDALGVLWVSPGLAWSRERRGIVLLKDFCGLMILMRSSCPSLCEILISCSKCRVVILKVADSGGVLQWADREKDGSEACAWLVVGSSWPYVGVSFLGLRGSCGM